MSLSNSKEISVQLPLFTSSEIEEENSGIYLGKTLLYKLPFFLDTNNLLNPHISIIGMTGSGKTYFMKSYIVKSHLQANSNVLILDWNGEYRELISFLGGEVKEFDPDMLEGLLDSVVSISLSKVKDEKLRKSAANRIFDTIFDAMYKMPIDDKKKKLIVVDEAWKLLDDANKLGRLFREGRKYGVSVMISTQLANDVKNEILANSGTIVIFRLQNAADCETLINSGIISSDLRLNLSELKIGNCILRMANKNDHRITNILIKKIEGVDISTYNLYGAKMQIKITNKNFIKITETVIDSEIKAKLVNFVEANERSLDIRSLVSFLRKNGLKSADIVTYLRLLGFNDTSIVIAFESTKKEILVTK